MDSKPSRWEKEAAEHDPYKSSLHAESAGISARPNREAGNDATEPPNVMGDENSADAAEDERTERDSTTGHA